MRILINTTSPYARIARIALAEKGVDISGAEVVNPWGDDPKLLQLNTAARVPTLQLDDGTPLTESLLILMWLEKTRPEPSLIGDDVAKVFSQAGQAMGVIDAMVHIMIGVLQYDPAFGEHRVGLRRRRSILNGFAALEADPPAYAGGVPSIAAMTAVVALDYLKLRFNDADWLQSYPRLEALRAKVAERPAYAGTAPHIA